eukprot:6186850-Pleurochrysis_carterae.AAC.2
MHQESDLVSERANASLDTTDRTCCGVGQRQYGCLSSSQDGAHHLDACRRVRLELVAAIDRLDVGRLHLVQPANYALQLKRGGRVT